MNGLPGSCARIVRRRRVLQRRFTSPCSVIDFTKIRLEMLLKMACDAELIAAFEISEERVVLVDRAGLHEVRPATARRFAETSLARWWREEERRVAASEAA